jgi:hypothetical protein
VGDAVAHDPLSGIRVAHANRSGQVDVLAEVLLERRRWEVVGCRSRWVQALDSPQTSLIDRWSPRSTWLTNTPPRLDGSSVISRLRSRPQTVSGTLLTPRTPRPTVVNSGSAWLPS